MTNQLTSYTTRVKVIPEPILIKVQLLCLYPLQLGQFPDKNTYFP